MKFAAKTTEEKGKKSRKNMFISDINLARLISNNAFSRYGCCSVVACRFIAELGTTRSQYHFNHCSKPRRCGHSVYSTRQDDKRVATVWQRNSRDVY